MHEHIKSAGFVVCNNEAIWSVGATSEQAWNSFVELMAENHTVIVEDGEEHPDGPEAWVEASDYKIRPATAALIEQVKERGGNVAWDVARGVLCTVEEFDGDDQR
jgi:hypothetical protein